MIDLRLIKPNLIYRAKTKYRLPVIPESRQQGSVYMTITKSIQNTASFFGRTLFEPRFLTMYYHQNLFDYKIYNSLVKYRLASTDLKKLFDEIIKPMLPFIDIKYTLASLNKKNYIHELAYLNEKFFSINDSRIGMKRVNEYFRLFKNFTMDKINKEIYTNKVLFIPIDEWISNPKDASLYQLRTADNFISLFYHKLVNDVDYFKNNFLDWKFYFIFGTQVFYMEPSTFDKDTPDLFKRIMFKLNLTKDVNNSSDNNIYEEINEVKNKTSIQDIIHDKLDQSDIQPNKELIDSLVNKTIEKINKDIRSDVISSINIDDIPSIKEIELEKIQNEIQNNIPNHKSKARIGRELQMIQNMKNIKLDDITIDEIQARMDSNKIEVMNIPVDVINPSLKEMKFPNFDEAYLKNLYKADIVKMVTSFQYKDHPLYLIDTSVRDVSDNLNDLEEYTFKFEDENGRRHVVVVDLPKMTNNRFMKIAGNKKIMVNQIIPIPITKTSPDIVQIATNYKQKVFIHRFGQSISPKISEIIKGLSTIINKDIKIELGSAINVNRDSVTAIEYDELAAKYRKLSTPNIEIFFDQNVLKNYIEKLKLNTIKEDNKLPIGIRKKKEIIYLNTDSNTIDKTDKLFTDFIIDELKEYEPSAENWFKNIKSGKKLVYSRANIMAKKVPLVILLAYLEGLLILLKKADIKYRIISKAESQKPPKYSKGKEDVIEFSNAWLVYDIYPLRNSLLLNGFVDIPTKIYKIEQFLTKDVYHEIFDTLFGRSNIGYAFENFQQILIDSLTEDVLRDHNLPTEFTDVFLYANSLLEDNAYNHNGDQTIHRTRSNEMISAFLYQTLAKAYEQYRLTANNPNPVKMSTKKNSVILDILTSQVTKDYSDLNPLYTLDLMRSTTFKGPAGMNQDKAYTLSKRSFHPSMLGILSQASPISGAIGIARTLTVDANITSARGYTEVADTKEKVNSLPSKKLLSGSELALPFMVTSDDPERVAMASAQSKHTLACVGSDRTPVGTGFEKVLPHLIGDTFVFKAKKNGKVIKIDKNSNVMIVKYDDSTIDTVSLNPQIGKNSGSGFYISNKLSPLLKEGDLFSAGKILAHNSEFFTVDKRSGDSVFMHGPLARVAIRYSSKVFEDSNIISKRLSEKMSSHIVIKKDVVLGHNSNIYSMVKKGQEIKVNEPLIIFDTSHTDELTNKILAKLSDESIHDLVEASKTPVISKHNGVIEDIKIYYTVPKEELSESARKIIMEYEEANSKAIKEVSKSTGLNKANLNISLTEISRVNIDASGKVKGVTVGNGILIEFYIKYKDTMSVGDKLATFVALKSVIADVFEEGKEPYLLSDKDDKIDAYLGAIGVGARLTFSVIKTMLINNIIIGTKKNVRKMYEDIYNEKL